MKRCNREEKPPLNADERSPSEFESDYHCSAEWHLRQLKSRFAPLVYAFSLRITKGYRKFFCSQVKLASYFQCSARSIWTAIHELERAGLFQLIGSGPFQTNVYAVLNHTNWAEKHPGCCVVKIQFPWSEAGDDLGKRLYAVSAGRVKFRPEQIAHMKRNFSECAILQGFNKILASKSICLDPHGFIDMDDSPWEDACEDFE